MNDMNNSLLIDDNLLQIIEEQKHQSDIEFYKDKIKDLEDKSHQKDMQIGGLNARCHHLEHEYNKIIHSKWWKITKPGRIITNMLKKFILRNILSVKIINALKTIRNEGFKGLKIRRKNNKKFKKYFKNENLNVLEFISFHEALDQINKTFEKNVKMSIIVPLYNTNAKFLHEMIASVFNQTYNNWELCMYDGSDEKHKHVEEICKKYTKNDNRIKYLKTDEGNLGISGNTNKAISLATGDYLVMFDHDDIMHPSALYYIVKAINEHNADFIYTDESIFETNINKFLPSHFKPDFSPDMLRSHNYICHISAFSKDLFNQVGGYSSLHEGSQDYDMVLKLTEKAKKIYHIPKALYYWRNHPGSVASGISAKPYCIESAKKAVKDHIDRIGLQGQAKDSKAISTYKIDYMIMDNPKISIIIPNKDHVVALHVCIDSIIKKSTYNNYEIIIIENNSVEKNTFEYYDQIIKNPKIKVVTYNGDFNYSAIMNLGVKFSNGEYLLLLDNDTEIITKNWIEEMLMYAQRPDVGAVGAKLYYKDDTVQHAGIILGMGADGIAGHPHKGAKKGEYGYAARLTTAHNLSAVTAACLMMKKEIFNEIDGFNENLCIAFNDVDLCLEIRKKGYLIVFTPYAELYHYESKSRGQEDTPDKIKRFNKEVNFMLKKWGYLLKNDPYYNENLTLTSSDFSFK